MSNETAKCNDHPAGERSCPAPAGSQKCDDCGQVWASDGTVEVMANDWCSSCMKRMKELHAASPLTQSTSPQHDWRDNGGYGGYSEYKCSQCGETVMESYDIMTDEDEKVYNSICENRENTHEE